mmetsp:Transcript_8126/g.18557  ORF Transcript_8126/g.18557 Transcript_8126/m.18557 type:complete len:207 (-) Transcript_8126:491-1111(-)
MGFKGTQKSEKCEQTERSPHTCQAVAVLLQSQQHCCSSHGCGERYSQEFLVALLDSLACPYDAVDHLQERSDDGRGAGRLLHVLEWREDAKEGQAEQLQGADAQPHDEAPQQQAVGGLLGGQLGAPLFADACALGGDDDTGDCVHSERRHCPQLEELQGDRVRSRRGAGGVQSLRGASDCEQCGVHSHGAQQHAQAAQQQRRELLT